MRSKRLIALMLTIVMAFAMSATAFATEPLPPDPAQMGTDGEIGNFAPDGNPQGQEKIVIIYKQLFTYNPDGSTVKAPEVSYSYGIAPATVTSQSVSDEQDPTVSVNVRAGVGDPTITGSFAWTNDTELNTASDGYKIEMPITIDFSSVLFEGAGVYRYVITETADGIDGSGMTPGTSSRQRYLDVYVQGSPNCGEGTDPDDWEIYGYTCFVNNVSITKDNKKTDAAKTNGFGSYKIGNDTFTADSYYTFNLKISKTVQGDNFAANNIAFPFTVIFSNDDVTGSIDISSSVTGTVNGFRDPAAGALSSTKGIAEIKHGASVTYIGIPCGTDVEVYETNIATGVTYEVTTTLSTSSAAATPETVTAGSKPTTAVAQSSPKEAYQSTKSVVDTTADTKQTSLITISITNKYSTISPTGVIVRYAPYALVLICGILLLLLGWKFLRRKETA